MATVSRSGFYTVAVIISVIRWIQLGLSELIGQGTLFDRGPVRLFVSLLLYVEALGHSRTEPFNSDAEALIVATLDSPRVIVVEFSRFVAKRVRSYCHSHRLKPYDAIHLASAVAAKAEVLMACDTGFPFEQDLKAVYGSLPYAPAVKTSSSTEPPVWP